MSNSFDVKALGRWEDDPLLPHVSADEHLNHKTKLFDHEGKRLYRQRRPIGFGRDNEWQIRYLSHKS